MDGGFSESLGQFLKNERESRSVSLEELSKGTRISRLFLEALEKDDYLFFPQRDFIPGFLKGYARYLGLDPAEILQRYLIQSELRSRQETFQQLPLFPTFVPGSEGIPAPEEIPKKQTAAKARKRSHRSIYIQLAIILVAIGLSLYFLQLLKKTEDPQKAQKAADPSSLKTGKEKAESHFNLDAREDKNSGGETSMENSRKELPESPASQELNRQRAKSKEELFDPSSSTGSRQTGK